MALGQDQLCNLHGLVQIKNVGAPFKKQGNERVFLSSTIFFSTYCGVFYLLLIAAHPWTWGSLQVQYRPMPVPSPFRGRKVSAVTAGGQGSGLRTRQGEADSIAHDQGSQPPVHAPLSHQIVFTKHRFKCKIKNFMTVIVKH